MTSKLNPKYIIIWQFIVLGQSSCATIRRISGANLYIRHLKFSKWAILWIYISPHECRTSSFFSFVLVCPVPSNMSEFTEIHHSRTSAPDGVNCIVPGLTMVWINNTKPLLILGKWDYGQVINTWVIWSRLVSVGHSWGYSDPSLHMVWTII